MNDRDQNHVHTGEAYQAPSKPRSRARRRWGGRVFAFGAFLLLTTGISLGASRHHAQQRQALLTADETRRFAPSVLVAPVEAGAAVVPVTLPPGHLDVSPCRGGHAGRLQAFSEPYLRQR